MKGIWLETGDKLRRKEIAHPCDGVISFLMKSSSIFLGIIVLVMPMLVRFGFVAISLQVKNASPSKTMTVQSFKKIVDREAAIRKVIRIAEENIRNTQRIIYHCIAHDIMFYRLSSKLIPLAGHELVKDEDLIGQLTAPLKELGELILEKKMRTGFHPDHFNVLNTPRKSVLDTSIRNLKHHVQILKRMGLGPAYKCTLHVGGVYGDKEASSHRFVEHVQTLDPEIRACLSVENDDKSFTAQETLTLACQTGLPMVLDIHHHRCNPGEERLEDLWPEIAATWSVEPFPPKVHISSPKSTDQFRHHADYINPQDLLPFLRMASNHTEQIDVMIEAKNKDQALFRLMEDLTEISQVTKVNQAAVWIET